MIKYHKTFLRTDDATHDSAETVITFTVSQTSHTRESLEIHKSKSKRTWLEPVSFRRIATVEQLQLEQTHTHTQSALPYPSCG